uniref:Uncharacterized protein n=1 Tax=Anguilla anguilla TaxID=7936 RepID=A0A0E9XQN5_ANGAN
MPIILDEMLDVRCPHTFGHVPCEEQVVPEVAQGAFCIVNMNLNLGFVFLKMKS